MKTEEGLVPELHHSNEVQFRVGTTLERVGFHGLLKESEGTLQGLGRPLAIRRTGKIPARSAKRKLS
jgi:hypothetical protein